MLSSELPCVFSDNPDFARSVSCQHHLLNDITTNNTGAQKHNVTIHRRLLLFRRKNMTLPIR